MHVRNSIFILALSVCGWSERLFATGSACTEAVSFEGHFASAGQVNLIRQLTDLFSTHEGRILLQTRGHHLDVLSALMDGKPVNEILNDTVEKNLATLGQTLSYPQFYFAGHSPNQILELARRYNRQLRTAIEIYRLQKVPVQLRFQTLTRIADESFANFDPKTLKVVTGSKRIPIASKSSDGPVPVTITQSSSPLVKIMLAPWVGDFEDSWSNHESLSSDEIREVLAQNSKNIKLAVHYFQEELRRIEMEDLQGGANPHDKNMPLYSEWLSGLLTEAVELMKASDLETLPEADNQNYFKLVLEKFQKVIKELSPANGTAPRTYFTKASVQELNDVFRFVGLF